jgi:protein O-mannosyl-transferase
MTASSQDTPQRGNAYYAWAVCGFLLVAIWLIYFQTLEHRLLEFDDNGFVYDNPQITAGLTSEGIRWAFTEGPYGEWYPLAPLSHMLDCQLYGLNAWGHHLTNVLLHAAGSIGLFLVLWRMTAELWPSAFAAVVFAVHPQHVESVAWVSERRDVLSGLFFMLTLAAYLGYIQHGRSLVRYALVAALFALGLMSKPMLVTLPPLLLLLDFWPLGRLGMAGDLPNRTRSVPRPAVRWLVLEKIPLLALAVGDCFMTLRTHYATTAPLGWAGRIGNAAVSCVTYIEQFFYPLDLAAIYPLPPGGPSAWRASGAIAILAAASAAAVIYRRRCPYLFVGWFWFLGMLAPVLGIVRVADHAMADRYMYLPGIGLYIALAWGAARLAPSLPAGRWVLVGGSGLTVALLIVASILQASYWRDDETLFTHTLACTTDNATAEVLLGVALAQQERYDEAIALYRAALEIRPDWYEPHLHLGSALTRVGQYDEALEQLRQALENHPRPYRIYTTIGELLLVQQKFDEARAAFEQAIALEPGSIPAYNYLGISLFLQGKYDEAIVEYTKALQIDANFALGHLNLADALAAKGQFDQAILHCRRALEIDRNNPAAQAKLDALQRASQGRGGQPPR